MALYLGSQKIASGAISSGDSGGNINLNEIYNALYPIGRGFIDFTNTDYSNWLGFTWERELVGLTPVGYKAGDGDFGTIGKTGGSKTHKHLQTVGANAGALFGEVYTTAQEVHVGNNLAVTNTSDYIQNHPNIILSNTYDSSSLQPYKVVAYWKRVA